MQAKRGKKNKLDEEICKCLELDFQLHEKKLGSEKNKAVKDGTFLEKNIPSKWIKSSENV